MVDIPYSQAFLLRLILCTSTCCSPLLAPLAQFLLLIPNSIAPICSCSLSSYLQEQLRLLAGLVTKTLGGAHVYTGQKHPVTETPMFALQLLCIYHLIIESSHHGLSLEPLRPSQHHTKGILEVCCRFFTTATALRASRVSQCQSVPFP